MVDVNVCVYVFLRIRMHLTQTRIVVEMPVSHARVTLSHPGHRRRCLADVYVQPGVDFSQWAHRVRAFLESFSRDLCVAWCASTVFFRVFHSVWETIVVCQSS